MCSIANYTRPHRVTENVDVEDVEQASLDTKISSSYVGFRLLEEMGWKAKGLGKQEQWTGDSVLGKQEEDDYFTAEENKLDIEIEETEESAKKREDDEPLFLFYVAVQRYERNARVKRGGMTKMADARKQQQMQQNKQEEDPENVPASSPAKTTVIEVWLFYQRAAVYQRCRNTG
ncbi:hypothetical protein Bca52824_093428 [Brassica carinata]|uniref:G-patch domain-containing protein n=1 Tax=Brassica carinata TaxID=52824 RepID=A0A8X7P5X9_BRACI|nr:hypothetical protein Bca52824_093428 [Brassica carinata]